MNSNVEGIFYGYFLNDLTPDEVCTLILEALVSVVSTKAMP